MSDTVEWGKDRPSRLVGLVTGGRLARTALPGALVGLAVVLLSAAEVLPWMRLGEPPTGNDGPVDLPGAQPGREFRLADFNTWEVFGYHLGWITVLALACAALAARPAQRRLLGATALGAAGGLVAMLVGLVQSVLDGDALVSSSLFSGDAGLDLRLAPGAFCAAGALLIVAGALAAALGLRPPRRSEPTPQPEYAPTPEVTVSAS
jgi:hypothetical protein